MARKPRRTGIWLDALELEDGGQVVLQHESALGLSAEVAPWGGLPASKVAALDFVAINHDLVSEKGWDLQVTPGEPYAWHLSAPGPERPAVFLEDARAEEPDCVLIEEEDPLTAHFDLRAAGRFGFLLPGGRGVVIDARKPQPVVSFSSGTRAVQADLPQPKVQSWLGDEVPLWLADVLAESDNAFRKVANAGTWVRLRLLTREQLASFKSQIVMGQRDPRFESARSWATRWTVQQSEAVELAATKRLVELDCTLAQGGAQHDSPCQLLLARDDLESVRLLLALRGEATPFEGELRRFDAHGYAAFAEMAGVAQCADNERLRRARVIDPDAWWALAATGETQ